MTQTSFAIKLSKRGQTVIPKTLRKEIGDNFTIIYDKQIKKWVIVNVVDLVDQMAGILNTGSTSQSLKDQIRKEENSKSKLKFNLTKV
jgi:bifunctional DNA-binding transcriptional regulator/antitoxin component of YhaV-PrlF toxin-antitoxin module